jgi:stringent starvation protein B
VSDVSTKPYLIRAIYEWCVDCGLTPHLAVQVDDYTQVPMNYVNDGSIVLNVSSDAVRNLQLGNEEITCGGRFGGVPHQLFIPIGAVVGIFAKETGQGLVFQGQDAPAGSVAEIPDSDKPPTPPQPPRGKPKFTVVK